MANASGVLASVTTRERNVWQWEDRHIIDRYSGRQSSPDDWEPWELIPDRTIKPVTEPEYRTNRV